MTQVFIQTYNVPGQLDELQQKPLVKKTVKRPDHFIRYMPPVGDEAERRYGYEATQEDLQFLSGLKGSPFMVQEFERLMNFFERENADEGTVKPFEYFVAPMGSLGFKQGVGDIQKVYEVFSRRKIVVLEPAKGCQRRQRTPQKTLEAARPHQSRPLS